MKREKERGRVDGWMDSEFKAFKLNKTGGQAVDTMDGGEAEGRIVRITTQTPRRRDSLPVAGDS